MVFLTCCLAIPAAKYSTHPAYKRKIGAFPCSTGYFEILVNLTTSEEWEFFHIVPFTSHLSYVLIIIIIIIIWMGGKRVVSILNSYLDGKDIKTNLCSGWEKFSLQIEIQKLIIWPHSIKKKNYLLVSYSSNKGNAVQYTHPHVSECSL